MKEFIRPSLGSLAVFLWIVSFCRGAPVRDNRNKPPPSSFTWEAFIHGPTGVASSNERSGPFKLAKNRPSLWSLLRKKISTEAVESESLSSDQDREELEQQLTREEEHLIVETSRQFVDAWSDFLCQGSISLGILRCEKERNDEKKTKRKAGLRRLLKPKSSVAVPDNRTAVTSSSLLARFTPFAVKLLEFGNPVESSSPHFLYQRGVKSTTQNSTVVLGSWDIPLQGGALIFEDDQPQEQKSSLSTKHDSRCRGKLMFAIVKTTPDKNKGGDSIESRVDDSSYEIITGIRNYRPWLAGGGYAEENEKHDNIWDALKANRETTTRRLCHGFYLSTQSMVHAYVTWRFHNAWKKELVTAVRTTMKSASDKEST